MDTQNLSAPSRAQSGIAGKNHPRTGGLDHDHTRHSTRFTVVGNHLVQHAELSLLAIGLACHIQSLPKRARVDIKTLAARFPEGTTRIAAALRELEAHGYLRRERQRVPGGRIVSRTISCNQPGRRNHGEPDHTPAPAKKPRPTRKKPLPAVPQPSCPSPTLLQQATDLLAGLRREDPRLLLSTNDTSHLAPGVAAWLERDLTPTAVRQALTTDLPESLCRPAALLAHRLTAQLPPPPPFRAPSSPPPVRHPLRNCDDCDRAFRGPEPGRCGACRDRIPAVTI
ncbi:helix-turn-helix domain-containing protein [Streptomyces sp. NBC_00564]|uniref:helix-turn-helix domain-containing protein n=1 Tax=unclassified Streptomyces TaxID=2593676 RepID=UPI003254C90C|nr:helix-turn-helix domain-containing protein [Streptomyces sp. NBC_00564]